jgi:uncharacterized protein DUF397
MEGGRAMDLTGATWRKARRSTDNGGNCVELAALPEGTAVRDSKNPTGPALAFTRDEWRRFTGRVRRGAHDLG